MGWLGRMTGVKVAQAVALIVLVAPILSACDSSGPPARSRPDSNARRLPPALDLDRLAGVRLPGTPRCEFETVSRTFLGKAWGPLQDLPLICRGVEVSGGVRVTYGEARRAVAEKLECRRAREKDGHAVHCGVRHDRLGVGTTASCPYFESYCGDERWPRMETDARALIVRLIELLEPLAQGATPAVDIDPTALPPTIDLNRLAGRALPGTPFEACAFDDEPGSVTIGLRCGSSASGVVGIGETKGEPILNPEPGIPDDIVVCSRGARQSVCYMRHGTLQLSTTVDCQGPRRRPARDGCGHGASPSSLMARVAQLLATLR